jgi:hypothetical protein
MAKTGGLVTRKAISLPPAIYADGERRMRDLGFSKFSQYIAFLIVRDVERAKAEQLPEKKIRMLRVPPGAVPPGVQATPAEADKRARAVDNE